MSTLSLPKLEMANAHFITEQICGPAANSGGGIFPGIAEVAARGSISDHLGYTIAAGLRTPRR